MRYRFALSLFGVCALHAADALGPTGVNVSLARTQKLSGEGHPVVVFEHSTGSTKRIGIEPGHRLGDRLINQRNFSNQRPPVMPLVGEVDGDKTRTVTCPNLLDPNGPPFTFTEAKPCEPKFDPLKMDSNHATQVAHTIAAEGEEGVAPKAYVFGMHFSAGDTDDKSKSNGVEVGALNEVRAGVDWITRNHADSNLDGCVDKGDIVPGGPKVWNFSWGYPNDGKMQNQLTRFVDWFTWRFNGDTLFVVAAGNEGE